MINSTKKGAALLPAVALLAAGGILAALLFSRPHSSPAVTPNSTPPAVAREFRGVWVTPLDAMTGPDWPSKPGLSAARQQAELRALLDNAQAIGLNAIVLHVRTAADALYPSRLVPWSAFLSGQSGVAPSPAYDPLAFAVAEAHARGLQLHAWFNPFRAMLPNFAGRAAPTHVTRAHKSWIRSYGTQTWIDPGDPAARAAVLAEIMDVVDRYDIDAVHLDDYFYPYRERQSVVKRVHGRRTRVSEDIPFPDASTWRKYGGAERGFSSREDWRRANIDTFVQQLYQQVKQRKPWVMVGISPFGIWRSGVPRGITGLDAYGEIYADARKWLVEGWVDYLAPQLYWPINGVQSRFTTLDDWWRTQNPKSRAIWPGLFDAQVAVRAPGWTGEEMPAQISRLRYTRELTEESVGHVHFRMGALLWNYHSIGERLRTGVYAEPAIVPAMPWLGDIPPLPPRLSVIDQSAVQVTPSGNIHVAWWLIQSLGGDGRWRTTLRRAIDRRIELASLPDLGGGTLAVTAIDRAGQASDVTTIEIARRP